MEGNLLGCYITGGYSEYFRMSCPMALRRFGFFGRSMPYGQSVWTMISSGILVLRYPVASLGPVATRIIGRG